jgi:hypothetical protein
VTSLSLSRDPNRDRLRHIPDLFLYLTDLCCSTATVCTSRCDGTASISNRSLLLTTYLTYTKPQHSNPIRAVLTLEKTSPSPENYLPTQNPALLGRTRSQHEQPRFYPPAP